MGERKSRDERQRTKQAVEELASRQGGVVSRRQVYDLGMTRSEVRAQVAARRWQRVWSRSLCTHTGEVGVEGRHWAAVFEGGERAMLDGPAALIASGLVNYHDTVVRVSVPRGVKPLRGEGLDVRRTRRLRESDRAPGGVPRTKVPIAAVRAALWAVSDKQAALLLTMPVQQGLTTAREVSVALLRVKRDKRRKLLHAVALDLIGGAQSLGELEFAVECRARGLPTPTRQAVRRGKDGRYYLDVRWDEHRVVVEIDGIHHSWAQNVVPDALRQNEISLDGDTVLRLPLLGYRVARDEFFDQIRRALEAAERRGRAA